MRVDAAGVVPAYQQSHWVREVLAQRAEVSIMERAVLLALAVSGELDVADNQPVRPLTAAQLRDWIGFSADDVWLVAQTLVNRRWLLDCGEKGFALRVAYPVVEDTDDPSVSQS